MTDATFDTLLSFLQRIPAIQPGIGSGMLDDGNWWIKCSIDIHHDLAWQVVQEIGHVVNYLSLSERLPCSFYPVSAPPYLNGGPAEFLYWIIESTQPDFSPDTLAEWLEGRLPDPVDDVSEWAMED